MQTMKRTLAMLLAVMMVVACLPAVAMPAAAEETVQTAIWNLESGADDISVTRAHDTRNDSLTTTASGKGVSGSKALKYEATEADVITTAADAANNKPYARSITQTLSNMTWATYGGINATVKATDDIFWLWVDADWSTTQRFTFQLEGKDVLIQTEGETYIYTIVDVDGTATMQKVLYSADPADTVDSIDLVNENPNTNAGTKAMIRLSKDFCGWIGIPLNMLNGAPAVDSTLTKFSLLLNQYTCDDPIEDQQVGDTVYMDEFWLTSAGMMPNLTNEELLYNGDPVEVAPETHQTAIWNLESGADDISVTRAHDTRNDSLTTTASGKGVSGSKALKYAATEAGTVSTAATTSAPYARSITHTLSGMTWATYGGTNATVQAADDIFWMWVDADWSTSQRFTFQLMGKDVLIQTEGETYIYTIVDVEGTAAMQKVLYSADPANPVDAVDGLDLVNTNPNTNRSATAQIRLSKDFCGWIGIPLNMLNGAPAVDSSLTQFNLMLNQYTCDDPIENQQVGDAVYMDEFWLTSADTMPNLSAAELLYDGDPVPTDYVTLSGRYQDGMIFQQNKPWMVHGTATAGAVVTVSLRNSSNAVVKTASVTAGEDESWSVILDGVGGSYDTYTVQITCAGLTETLENVVFGEVWVAGGQSNMDYTINQTAGNVGNDDYAATIAEAFGSIQDVNDLQTRLAAEGSNAEFIRMYLQDSVAADAVGKYTDAQGRWTNGAVWTDVQASSALAFYYAEMLQKELGVPVGIIETPKGGTSMTTWVDEAVLTQQTASGIYKYQDAYDLAVKSSSTVSTNVAYRVGAYFNTRIAPFQGYEVKGVLWYQGENDRNQPQMQAYMPEVLVESWSKVFTTTPDTVSDTALDFVVFQIAPFAGYDSNGVYPDADLMDNTALNAEMREGFAKVQESGNVVIIPIYDLSAVLDNHHPLNKLDVATRAFQVINQTYYNDAAENVYPGPGVTGVTYGDGKVTLTFDQNVQYIPLTETDNQRIAPEGTYILPDADELWGDKLNGFSIWTGSAYVSVAEAVVSGNAVELTVPEGVETVAGVAYAYGVEVLSANLYNADGLPALPFMVERAIELAGEQTPLWKLDSLEPDSTVGSVEASANNDITSTVAADTGVSGSNALAITLTNVISGKTASDILTIDLAQYGFDTAVETMYDQVLWFWVDADLSAELRVHMLLNGLRMRAVEGDVIYTIQADGNGDAVIVEVPWQHSDADDQDGVDGLSFVHYVSGASNPFARPKFNNDWSGWVGIPLEHFLETGTTMKDFDQLTTLELQLYKSNDQTLDQGTLVNGDVLYIDEFWLTDKGLMPALDNEVLLYVGDVTEPEPEPEAKQDLLWDVESLETGATVGTITANTSQNTMSSTVVDGVGMLGSKAWAYAVTESKNNNNFELVTVDLTKVGFDTNVAANRTQILWFWVDADLSSVQRLHFEVNGSRMSVDPDAGATFYTILADASGKPAIVEVPYQYGQNPDEDGVDGLSFLHYNSTEGNTNKFARPVFTGDWCGWVGIPVQYLYESDNDLIADGETLTTLKIQSYRNNGFKDENGAVIEGTPATGDAIYFDEFWLTDAGTMPKLSDEALLYRGLRFTGASLVIENGISVNFKMDDSFGDMGFSAPYAVFQINDVENTVQGVYDEAKGVYVFNLYNIRPDWMGDTITATVYATCNGTVLEGETKLYSVAEYCYNQLEGISEKTELATLLVDLLNYGAATQLRESYKTDALVTADLTDGQKAWGTSGTPAELNDTPVFGSELTDPTAVFKGAALYLRETVRIRLRFTADSIEGVTVTAKVGDVTTTIENADIIDAGNGSYYVFFDGLNATQMREPVTFTVLKDGTAISNTLVYSVEAYAASVNTDDTALTDMIYAMMRYGDSAIAYVTD